MGGACSHAPLEYIHLKLIITPRITKLQLAAIKFWKHFMTSNIQKNV